MRFIVHPVVFQKLPDVCFGVVVAKGVDNQVKIPMIDELLSSSILHLKEQFQGSTVKELGEILPYRIAFQALGFNPNKFLPSIEALMTRILKGGQIPSINNVVDLANAISLKHIVPIGAHDIDCSPDDIEVRFSIPGDTFIPFGSTIAENPDPAELIYVRGKSVKTRRWIWRQSDIGKIDPATTNIFFPIDGFQNKNLNSVISARDELAGCLEKYFNLNIKVSFVNIENPSFSF